MVTGQTCLLSNQPQASNKIPHPISDQITGHPNHPVPRRNPPLGEEVTTLLLAEEKLQGIYSKICSQFPSQMETSVNSGFQVCHQVPENTKIQDGVLLVSYCSTSSRGLPSVSGYQGCLPAHSHFPASNVSSVFLEDNHYQFVVTLWLVLGPRGVHRGVGSASGFVENQGNPGQLASKGAIGSETDHKSSAEGYRSWRG